VLAGETWIHNPLPNDHSARAHPASTGNHHHWRQQNHRRFNLWPEHYFGRFRTYG
jgi:hypothetical protein